MHVMPVDRRICIKLVSQISLPLCNVFLTLDCNDSLETTRIQQIVFLKISFVVLSRQLATKKMCALRTDTTTLLTVRYRPTDEFRLKVKLDR